MAKVRCPFCNSIEGDEYTIQLHIEEFHTEDSPFVADVTEPSSSEAANNVSRSSNSMPHDTWTKCTRRGCGEYVLLSAIDKHLDFHTAAELAEQDSEGLAPPLPPRRSLSPANGSPRPRKHMSHEASVRSSPPRLEKQRVVNKEDRQSISSMPSPNEKDRQSSNNTLLKYFAGSSSMLTRSNLKALQAPRNPGRLGERELGPYAFEKSMPSDVRKSLIYGAESRTMQRIGSDGRLYKYRSIPNETAGLPTAIADLCALEEYTAVTYLCHPSTKHIYKIECDGNFCGFWSTQVVLSYVQHMDPEGPQAMPHVIEMQDIIETAWKNGICAYDKVQTGGVMNTRKWIGTTEALAFFTQIGVKVDALTFKGGDGAHGKTGVEQLLDHVEAFYMSGADTARKHGSSHITQLPPIYFQRFGHSMTIVGLERLRNGTRNLLVFDSSFATPKPMQQLAQGRNTRSNVSDLLKPYRRSDRSLSRWDEFEVLM
ncbi:Putative peptidase C78, ubiquitin modifier-specific peptidase 1/ 2 [Septoria linicola]|uniref:Peptidase C78, ubiquitin modifier-specific peptidase 1/ 2 n=1 Tax=Septoria linicola TaxID=215465 RepID=A0A9Q9EHK9_9PEZI|nr:putative peptidase C78, ubiquitin modifier-specific peptidase 1/ 2 [Septoria linicola]USW51090.1 Putative peptidase C78, ubiquitin modifier-specific peptidase 1/ 2 [Septoria linicola]